jgi:lipopolysaccharide/colanic/teichoic acid biosynthesis glycosyltransferase
VTAPSVLEREAEQARPAPPESPLTAALRRGMDLAVAGTMLLLTAPIFVVAGALVRFSSPGPILFRQVRVGRDGRHFELLKFRSMRVANAGPSVTSGTDARITPVGRILRKLKMDELPQLVNVLRGEMSMVGPRPEVPKYVAHYTERQRRVLSVRPGITGVCQLEFKDEEGLLAGREDVERFYIEELMPRKLELDLRYIDERTLLGDFLLILKTGVAILRRG